MDELHRTLIRKMKIASGLAAEIRAELEKEFEMVEPEALLKPISRDRDDDWVLATALSGRAEIIVSGDQDLLVLKEFQGIRILTPRQFVELINA